MYGSNFMMDRLVKQKDDIENLIQNYKNMAQQTPVNNFINANQPQTNTKDLVEWRILNENEEVDNLYVQNKTLFISDNLMVLKGIDGSLEKWEIKKVYPIDKKDKKISELEEEIKKLKEMVGHEFTKPVSTDGERIESDTNVNVNAESKSKEASK